MWLLIPTHRAVGTTSARTNCSAAPDHTIGRGVEMFQWAGQMVEVFDACIDAGVHFVSQSGGYFHVSCPLHYLDLSM